MLTIVTMPSVIREARRLIYDGLELISDERRWTTNFYARDHQGRKVEPGNRRPRPVAWCLAGCLFEAEHRAAVAEGAAHGVMASVLSRPPSRFALAVTATWLSCEHAFWDAPGTEWTLERALAFASDYLVSLPAQIAFANDRFGTSHSDVCRVLEGAGQLLAEFVSSGAGKEPGVSGGEGGRGAT